MTNPAPHGQVPEALPAIQRFEVVDCIDSQHVPAVIPNPSGPWVRYEDHAASLRAQQPASPTPPAEQQATKETSGGFHVWRDISTAPKDGSRFVATGHNYGLYSEGRHICVAQWFRGCWMETSDWNEASELKHLTHWLPLPSPPDDVAAPAEQQAAPKTAPGEQNTVPAEWLEQAYREGWAACRDAETIGEEAEDWAFGNSTANSRMIDAQQAAPQQEAQEPVAWLNPWRADKVTTDYDAYGERGIPLYTAPQPVEREPLTHAQAKALVTKYGNDPLHLVYQVEVAHGIKIGGQHGADA